MFLLNQGDCLTLGSMSLGFVLFDCVMRFLFVMDIIRGYSGEA